MRPTASSTARAATIGQAAPATARNWTSGATTTTTRTAGAISEAGHACCTATSIITAVGTRAILTRMLNNLRSIYLANQDWGRLSAVLQRLAAVEPANGQHLQELAAIRYRQGDLRGAYAHLAACLERFPDAADRPTVQRSLETLERVIVAMN